MTDEELDQWRGQEAWRLRHQYPEDATEVIAARLAREGWTPPEPVDPDVLAFREWATTLWPNVADGVLHGNMDYTEAAKGYLAGARMAREQERERAKVLLECLDNLRQFSGWADGQRAAQTLAKYRGEA